MDKSYKKLEVWKKSDELVKKIYKLTMGFPDTEKFGVVSQLRRCGLSIPLNIVEGSGRRNKKEFKQFINIAIGSLFELEYLLDFSKDIGYIKNEDFCELEKLKEDVGKMLWGLYKSLK
ncbi:MAG: four helix bundle protein [Elusimicrobiota bacterium]